LHGDSKDAQFRPKQFLGNPVMPATKAGLLSYRLYTELPLIEKLSRPWDILLESTRCNRAFSSACWFLSVCKSDSSLVPCVITAWRGRKLAGILPLVHVPTRNSTEFAPFFSDYNDIIADPDDLPVSEGLLEFSFSRGKPLLLGNLRLDSACYRVVAQARPEFAERLFQIERRCLYISLDSSYDDYLASRSRSLRAELWRNERLARHDGLRIRALSPDDLAPELLPEVFLSISLERFKEKSAFQEPGAQAFVRAAFPDLFRQGRLKPFVLMAGERIVAINICMVGANGLCFWNGGFLREAAGYSPGKLLLAEQLRQSFALAMKDHDMLRGEHSYKARWATGARSIGGFAFAPGFTLLSERCPTAVSL